MALPTLEIRRAEQGACQVTFRGGTSDKFRVRWAIGGVVRASAVDAKALRETLGAMPSDASVRLVWARVDDGVTLKAEARVSPAEAAILLRIGEQIVERARCIPPARTRELVEQYRSGVSEALDGKAARLGHLAATLDRELEDGSPYPAVDVGQRPVHPMQYIV